MLKERSKRDKVPEWWETDTRVYRAMSIAEQWHVRPTEYLAWHERERLMAELYLLAKGLKQEAALKQQKEGTQEQQFDAQFQSWAGKLSGKKA